jgi:hypothetical protein
LKKYCYKIGFEESRVIEELLLENYCGSRGMWETLIRKRIVVEKL